MRKKDKLIKEALQIYQQEKRETLPVYQEEERDSFEDKIFEKIKKMNIPNPRRKAHIVSLVVVVVCVAAIGLFFIRYRQKNRMADITDTIEQFYRQGSKESKFGVTTLNGTIIGQTKEYVYKVHYLSNAQKNSLRKEKLPYKKTKYKLQQESVSLSDMKMGGMNDKDVIREKTWDVYRLSDRKSKCYYILKDKEEHMAIAKYAYAWQGTKGKDVLKDEFAIDKAKDIRSITLERYAERSRENTDRIVAIYTKEQEKANILQVLQRIDQDSEEPDEIEDWNAHWANWGEVTSKRKADCYYLTIENRQKEKWILGLYCSKKECILYQYAGYDLDTGDHFEVGKADCQWIYDWIKKADKEY